MKHSTYLPFMALILGAAASAAIAAPPKKVAKPAPAVKTPAVVPLKIVSAPPMWSVAYSPDGSRIAVGTYRRVLMFDTATGAKVGDYLVSSDAIRTLAFSPDGKELAAGTGVPDRSGSILILDPTTGKVVRTIKDHDDTIEAVAWEGANFLLTAADDETVGVDDPTTGKSVGSLTEHIGRCLSVAVPTKIDAANGGDIFATGGADKAVKIWDAKLRRVVVNFDQSTGPVWSLAAVTRPGSFIAGCDDGKIRLFQVRADGVRRAGVAASEPDPRTGYLAREQVANVGAVYAVAASPDGGRIVTGGADGKVGVWDSYLNGRQRTMTEAKRDIWCVAISPDSKQCAAASLDGKTRVYDIVSGALLQTFDVHGLVTAPVPPVNVPAAPNPTTPAVKKPPMPARMTMR